MTYDVLLTQTAVNDIETAIDYIEYSLNNPDAARNLLNLVENKLDTLKHFPKRNALVPDEVLASNGIRFMNINNYLAFYVIDEEKGMVIILRFLYNKRNWKCILRS